MREYSSSKSASRGERPCVGEVIEGGKIEDREDEKERERAVCRLTGGKERRRSHHLRHTGNSSSRRKSDDNGSRVSPI